MGIAHCVGIDPGDAVNLLRTLGILAGGSAREKICGNCRKHIRWWQLRSKRLQKNGQYYYTHWRCMGMF
jgi:hypothetical protein